MPTLAGFISWIRAVMGVSTTVLPDDSPVIAMAFNVALAIVNPALYCVGIPNTGSPGTTIYALATYNLGGDNLINYAQDLPDAAPVQGSDPPLPFFQWSRQRYDTLGFVSGVISSSHDESTGNTMVVQEAAKNFTLGQIQNLKTPWGRQYLALAQSWGPTTFGLS